MIFYLEQTNWYYSLGKCPNFKYQVKTWKLSDNKLKIKKVIIGIGNTLENAFEDWKKKYTAHKSKVS